MQRELAGQLLELSGAAAQREHGGAGHDHYGGDYYGKEYGHRGRCSRRDQRHPP